MSIDHEVLKEFRRFSEEELREIESDLNRWGTGLEFGCEPDLPHEAVHYVRSADGSLYCKHPKVKEIAGEKKVLPNMAIFMIVQVMEAFEYYKATHDGQLPEDTPGHREVDRPEHIVLMFFVDTGKAFEFFQNYTCPERLLGIATEELQCLNT